LVQKRKEKVPWGGASPGKGQEVKRTPAGKYFEEMAAVAMVILRSVCLVTRLAFADAHAAA
jgi:hypothetical protein